MNVSDFKNSNVVYLYCDLISLNLSGTVCCALLRNLGQDYKDKIRDIIYNYVEDFLIDKVKDLKFTQDLNLNFKWTPEIHVDILNVLDELELEYKTKIKISADHIDKNKGKDEFSEKVFKLLLNDDIKLYTNPDIDLPIRVRTWIMNIKRLFVYSQLSKLEINNLSFNVSLDDHIVGRRQNIYSIYILEVNKR